MSKEDVPVGGQVVHLAGRCLPQAEMYLLAIHLIVAEDGEVHFGLVGHIVEVHIRHTDALIVVEGNNFVIRVGIEDITYLNLSAERHVIRELAGLGFLVRALRNDLHLDE